jgi:dihydrofolate reductase
MISMVVATDKQGIIGRENKIPWRLQDDLVALRNHTAGHAVILGRRTYESMCGYYDKSGKPMPAKVYIVLTRDLDYQLVRDNALTVHSVNEALAAAQAYGSDLYIIGGAAVYESFLPYADRIYLTRVHTFAEGDVYFPRIDPEQWQETTRTHHSKNERNEFDYDVVTLDRV